MCANGIPEKIYRHRGIAGHQAKNGSLIFQEVEMQEWEQGERPVKNDLHLIFKKSKF
jgi:hypothetical protein